MTHTVQFWYLGLDLGQRRDHSALATLCRVGNMLILRDIERFPLGTSYTLYPGVVATRVSQIEALETRPNPAPNHLGKTSCPSSQIRPVIALAIDAAGPGAPVADELRRAHLNLDLRPCRITAGQTPDHPATGEIVVPRQALIGNLVNLIEDRRLRVPPDLLFWPAFRDELLALTAPDGKPADPRGHDDMVIAVALAAWLAESSYGRNASHFLRKSEPTARSHDP